MGQFQYFNPTFADQNGSVTNLTSTLRSSVLTPTIYAPVGGLSSVVLFGTVDVNTPGATTYASASKITSSGGSILFTKTTATGYFNGLTVQVSTDTTLPTNIVAITDYFVIVVSSTTFKLATTLANALAGTAIAYVDAGTGTQTVTPDAITGASIAFQGSFDYGIAATPNWVTIPNTTVTITVDGSFGPIELDYIRYPNIAAYAALTTGSMAFTTLQIGYQGGS